MVVLKFNEREQTGTTMNMTSFEFRQPPTTSSANSNDTQTQKENEIQDTGLVIPLQADWAVLTTFFFYVGATFPVRQTPIFKIVQR
jgi:hypothetical protein